MAQSLNLSMTQFLNAQRLTPLFAAQNPVEDDARNEYGREQIREQTESERDRETLHRAGSEQEQDGRRNDGGHVSVHNGDPGMAEALIHSGWRRLAVAQLFTDAFKNQHIGIYAHTDGKDHAGDSRQ